MEQRTLTMAGQQATAGGARLRGGSYGHLHAAAWSVGLIAEPTPATFVVFDGKNRHTRQPSELSP